MCAALMLAAPAAALATTHVRRAHRHGHVACSHARHHARHASSRGCVAGVRHASAGSARQRHHTPARPSASAQRAARRAGVIARALATPCENTQLTPQPSNLEAARAAVLCLVNHERAQDGELPLVVDPRLQAAAESHAQECISADYFAHVSPSGITPVDRIRSTGFIPGPEFGYLIGENLAWGTLSLSTPQAIVDAWMASPEHRANILEGRYVDTGIGIAPAVAASLSGGSPGGTYAQEFGTIIS
jgi:uncharacterized protein YkwD